MTKKIQEISLAFFLAVCGISMLMGILWMKPVLESQRLLIEETRQNQEKIMKSAEDTIAVITEIGYASAVIAMKHNRIIRHVDVRNVLQESVETIENHSERFGKLAKLLMVSLNYIKPYKRSGARKSIRNPNQLANAAIKNAYTTARAYFIDNPNGNVTVNTLKQNGFRPSEGVKLTIEGGTQKSLKMTSTHTKGNKIYMIDWQGVITFKPK